eukprot:3271155-Amphidinium_carterae.1
MALREKADSSFMGMSNMLRVRHAGLVSTIWVASATTSRPAMFTGCAEWIPTLSATAAQVIWTRTTRAKFAKSVGMPNCCGLCHVPSKSDSSSATSEHLIQFLNLSKFKSLLMQQFRWHWLDLTIQTITFAYNTTQIEDCFREIRYGTVSNGEQKSKGTLTFFSVLPL